MLVFALQFFYQAASGVGIAPVIDNADTAGDSLETEGLPDDFHIVWQSGLKIFGLGEHSNIQNAFDGDPDSYYAYAGVGEASFVGIDTFAPSKPLAIYFLPHDGNLTSMIGGRFEGSNANPLSGYEVLYEINDPASLGQNDRIVLSTNKRYRFYRYVGPDGSNSAIAEFGVVLEEDTTTHEAHALSFENLPLQNLAADQLNAPAALQSVQSLPAWLFSFNFESPSESGYSFDHTGGRTTDPAEVITGTGSLKIDNTNLPDHVWHRGIVSDTFTLTEGSRYEINLNFFLDAKKYPDSFAYLEVRSTTNVNDKYYFVMDREEGFGCLTSRDFLHNRATGTYYFFIGVYKNATLIVDDIEMIERPRLTTADLADPGVPAWDHGPIGVCQHATMLYNWSEAEIDIMMADLASAGVNWIRVSCKWGQFEPTKGNFDQTYIDRMHYIIDRAWAVGRIRSYLTFGATPIWASENPTPGEAYKYAPTNWADYENFIDKVMAEFGSKVQYYRIGNEPDEESFWKSGYKKFATMVKTASAHIKANKPNAQVILAGMTHDGVFASPTGIQNMLQKLIDEGCDPYIDVYCTHAYKVDAESTIYHLNNYYQVMQRNGINNKLIWIGEFGRSIADVTHAEQAAYLQDVYPIVDKHPRVGVMCWWNYRDLNTGSGQRVDEFGVVETDFTPKPSLTELQNLSIPLKKHIVYKFTQIDGL